MDERVGEFIRSTANTVLKLDILSYYHDHPYAMDGPEGLAGWLNRRRDDVARDLDELSKKGLLTREPGDPPVYAFTPDDSQSGVVAKVVESYRLTRDAVYGQVRELEQKQDGLRAQYEKILFTERRRTETILDSLEEAVLVLGADETVLLANESLLERFAGETAAGAGGAPLEQLIGDSEVKDALRRSLDSAAGGGAEELEFPHGDNIYRLRSYPVCGPDGEVVRDEQGAPVAMVTVFRDVSREREIERMREDFISMLTHDLKNPLGIIYGSSTLVLDGKVGLLSKKQEKLVRNIVKSCGVMERLVEDFLTLSRLEAGKLVISTENVDLCELAEGALELQSTQLEEKSLSVRVDCRCENPVVRADGMQLERVVSNLVGNAAKYNREGGSITVRILDDADREGFVRVEVEDTGMGIPEDELPHVFEKFRRSSSTERSRKGSGLGLTIARDLVQAMGGEIWACSREGEGSCFGFRLERVLKDS